MVAASAAGPEGFSEEAVSVFVAILVSDFVLEAFSVLFSEQADISKATERAAIRFFIFINTYHKSELQIDDFKNFSVKHC
jgi:hypothetical protein